MPGWMTLLLLLGGAPRETTFDFPAAAGRLDTGLFVARGERIEVTAAGRWTMWSAEFQPTSAVGHRFRVGEHGWGRLMGRIGAGDEVSIGTGGDWVATEPGVLYLYPHTGDYGIRGGDGVLAVTVRGGRPLEEYLAGLAETGPRVTVPADRGLRSDVLVTAGGEIQIDAVGEWTMYEGGAPVTATGDLGRRLPDGMPWGRLVARVGGPTFAVGEVYEIGPERTIRPKRTGLLHLYPATGPYAGHDRTGSLEVVIRGARRASAEEIAAAGREAEDHERSLAFLRVHQYRAAVGLAPAYGDPALMRAAQAHAEALASAQPSGTAAERVAAAGFPGTLEGVAVHGYTDGLKVVDGLWQTVYQRAIMVAPTARAVGVGIASGERPIGVVLTGTAQEPPRFDGRLPEMALFPPADQINVPTSWSGLGEPSVFREPPAGPVGTPLSLTVLDGEITEVRRGVMADKRGRPVRCLVVGPGRDPHDRLTHTAFVIPLEPLRTLETYEVGLDLVTTGGERQISWRFTTGLDRESVLPPPMLGQPSNPAIDLGR